MSQKNQYNHPIKVWNLVKLLAEFDPEDILVFQGQHIPVFAERGSPPFALVDLDFEVTKELIEEEQIK